MAGTGRMPRQQELHGFHGGHPPPLRRGHGPVPLHLVEEEIAIRRDEMRRLRADNHLFVEENVALRREIASAKEEFHALREVVMKVHADKESQTKELIKKGLKLENELRGLEPVRDEILKLKSDAQKLNVLRQELSSTVQNMTQELKNLQVENQRIPTLRLEIDDLRQELVRARSANEFEKKANADQMEQLKVLEKNLASMAREVEKLRADMMSMEKRARGSGLGAYSYSDGFGGGDKGFYGSVSWSSYEPRGFPRP
ncbi:hypothetical protein AXF42_Ash018934 [Apostasia shenzhenica]|uniref:Protein FLX-like 3 n=1 Tax=Apostasia shenzhenica TaxID=1088818 RepID=A0A2I0B4J9_9ASPA|nr:hypothetical protein AXF42_Ash018934 [Apostasia shenzhenica]